MPAGFAALEHVICGNHFAFSTNAVQAPNFGGLNKRLCTDRFIFLGALNLIEYDVPASPVVEPSCPALGKPDSLATVSHQID